MRLYVKCVHCKNEIVYKTNASTRVELKMIHGKSLELKCKTCGSKAHYLIDKLEARENKTILSIALLIFMIFTPLIMILFWRLIWISGLGGVLWLTIFISIPSYIYIILNKNEQNRVKFFNRS